MRITNPDGSKASLREFNPELADAANSFARAIYQKTTLPIRLFEAARIETALINGCLLCMNWQTARDSAAMMGAGGVADNGPHPDQAFYDTVLARRTDGLDDREIAAVEFARGMGANPHGLAADDALWDRMKQLFTDAEIVDLTYCVAGWMGLGRVAHVLGTDQGCEVPAPAAPQVEVIQLQQAKSMVTI